MTAQARNTWLAWVAWLKIASPAANTKLLAINTGRPPKRSMSWPATGPVAAETSSATEKAANTVEYAMPTARLIGSARTAGR
ncbi:hypothetical protein D3C86_2157000 [compost metagenome]